MSVDELQHFPVATQCPLIACVSGAFLPITVIHSSDQPITAAFEDVHGLIYLMGIRRVSLRKSIKFKATSKAGNSWPNKLSPVDTTNYYPSSNQVKSLRFLDTIGGGTAIIIIIITTAVVVCTEKVHLRVLHVLVENIQC